MEILGEGDVRDVKALYLLSHPQEKTFQKCYR